MTVEAIRDDGPTRSQNPETARHPMRGIDELAGSARLPGRAASRVEWMVPRSYMSDRAGQQLLGQLHLRLASPPGVDKDSPAWIVSLAAIIRS